MPKRRFATFFLVFLLSALVAGSAYRFIDRASKIAGCARYSAPRTFMAACSSPQFGDYEHGAYYLRLERAALSSLRAAEVLFLGSSKIQVGFSTQAVRSFFSAHAIRYYLFGFGYGEQDKFGKALVKNLGLKPKVLIIGADRFFAGGWSAPAWEFADYHRHLYLRAWSASDYLTRRLLIAVHPLICALAPARCTDTFGSIYRESDSGMWVGSLMGWERLKPVPVMMPNRTVYPANIGEDVKTAAIEFMREANVSPDCVILTAPPSSVDFDAYISELGRLLGAKVILPPVDDLETMDTVHLTAASAERWSAAVMRQAAQVIERCAGAKRPS